MKSMCRRTLFVLAIAALPGIAAADDAFTLRPADIYAGPDSEYPVIAQLPPNTEVGVAGCLSDWSWCDVTFANARGWIYAGDLGYPYQGRRVAIIEFGPRLHIPAVTFSLVSYWDAHYRSRPFFRERDQWAGRIHVEANRGGHPPHGARVAERAGQQAPSAQPPREQAQGAQQQPREAAAQRGPAEQRAQTEQHTRERNGQAQTKQPNREAQRAQPTQPQAAEGMRSREEAKAPSSGPQHEEAARAQSEPRAQAREQAHGNQSMAQERAGEREARTTPRNEQQARSSESDRGTAKGKQDERSKEERKQAEPQ